MTELSPLIPEPAHRAPLRIRPILLLCLLGLALPGWPAIAGESAGDARDSADEHLKSAEIALSNHEYKKAASEYRKAAILSGKPAIARQATRIAYTYGFHDDALEAAQRWVELDPKSDEALLYVAQLHLKKGDVRKSRRSFRDLLERGEEPVDERLIDLVPILGEEDPKDAYAVMKELARPYRDSAAANYAVGVLALQASDAAEALARAQAAQKLDAEWIKPKLLYARALLLDGRQDEAIDYAARIVGDNPQADPQARMELAVLYMAAGRDDDALSQVNQILLEQPGRTDALRLMAMINFRQENLDAARADFEDLLASGRYTMDALYYLARIADYRGDASRALMLYSQVTNGPHTVSSQRRAAGILARESDLDKALDHLQRFGEKHPNHAVDMVLAQAQILASHDRPKEALVIYDRMLSYRPEDERVLLGRAEVLLRLGKTDAALDEYRRAVELWPDSAMALNALGYTMTYHSDDYDEAARLIRKALDLEPDSAAIMDSWGWVLHRQGRHEEGLTWLERAWADVKDAEIALHIAEVLAALGRCEEADEMLAEAEALDDDHQLLKDSRDIVGACGD